MIPADAMETAINMVCEARSESVIVSSLPGAVIIARAIVAERERCAKVAEFWGCKGAAQEIIGDIRRIDQ